MDKALQELQYIDEVKDAESQGNIPKRIVALQSYISLLKGEDMGKTWQSRRNLMMKEKDYKPGVLKSQPDFKELLFRVNKEFLDYIKDNISTQPSEEFCVTCIAYGIFLDKHNEQLREYYEKLIEDMTQRYSGHIDEEIEVEIREQVETKLKDWQRHINHCNPLRGKAIEVAARNWLVGIAEDKELRAYLADTLTKTLEELGSLKSVLGINDYDKERAMKIGIAEEDLAYFRSFAIDAVCEFVASVECIKSLEKLTHNHIVIPFHFGTVKTLAIEDFGNLDDKVETLAKVINTYNPGLETLWLGYKGKKDNDKLKTLFNSLIKIKLNHLRVYFHGLGNFFEISSQNLNTLKSLSIVVSEELKSDDYGYDAFCNHQVNVLSNASFIEGVKFLGLQDFSMAGEDTITALLKQTRNLQAINVSKMKGFGDNAFETLMKSNGMIVKNVNAYNTGVSGRIAEILPGTAIEVLNLKDCNLGADFLIRLTKTCSNAATKPILGSVNLQGVFAKRDIEKVKQGIRALAAQEKGRALPIIQSMHLDKEIVENLGKGWFGRAGGVRKIYDEHFNPDTLEQRKYRGGWEK